MTQERTHRLRSYLAGVMPSGQLEELAAGPEAESMVEAVSADAARSAALNGPQAAGAEAMEAPVPPPFAGAAAAGVASDTVRRATEKLLQGAELDPAEEFVTEAIIIPDKRPAVLVQDGDYRVDHALWLHFDQDPGIRQRFRDAIRSIGRVELPDHPTLPYGGTAFVVGPDLLMTNRHVAEIFSSGLGLRDLRFRPGLSAAVDFRRELDRDESVSVVVRDVAMIHPHWDMALLRVEGLGQGQPPLALSLDSVEDLEGEEVAVIGYPAFDPRNDAGVQNTVFGGVYNVKRLQPGRLGPRRGVSSFQRSVNAATHDSSTLGGNSGSAVISARTGQVVALHFGGRYLDANFGVPAADLAADGRVVQAGVQFAGAPDPRPDAYADAWRAGLAVEATGTVAGAAATAQVAQGGAVTVTLPLTITVSIGSAEGT